MECFACKSNSGEKRLSAGPIIYSGKFWLVEHAYRTTVPGWLVISLKRHAEALHELSDDEWNELVVLQKRAVSIIREQLKSEKEYVACYAEAEHFQHIHFHVIPKVNLPGDFVGSKIHKLLGPNVENPISNEEVIKVSNLLKSKW